MGDAILKWKQTTARKVFKTNSFFAFEHNFLFKHISDFSDKYSSIKCNILFASIVDQIVIVPAGRVPHAQLAAWLVLHVYKRDQWHIKT